MPLACHRPRNMRGGHSSSVITPAASTNVARHQGTRLAAPPWLRLILPFFRYLGEAGSMNDGRSMGESSTRSVLVFTATYNEVENVGPLVEQIFTELPHCDVLVVDDNSPDGTGIVLDRLKLVHSRL